MTRNLPNETGVMPPPEWVRQRGRQHIVQLTIRDKLTPHQNQINYGFPHHARAVPQHFLRKALGFVSSWLDTSQGQGLIWWFCYPLERVHKKGGGTEHLCFIYICSIWRNRSALTLPCSLVLARFSVATTLLLLHVQCNASHKVAAVPNSDAAVGWLVPSWLMHR